jgi:hypothetical protein
MHTASDAGWKTLLRNALYEQAEPVFTCGTTTVPAASIWTGSRLWTNAFRANGLLPGDTIAVDLAAGPVMAQVLVAALWEDLVVVLVPPHSTASLPVATRVVICDSPSLDVVPVWCPMGVSGPAHPLCSPAVSPHHEHVLTGSRFLTRGSAGWSALSDSQVLKVLDHALATNSYRDAAFASTSSWSDERTLVNHFLAPLFGKAGHIIIHEPDRELVSA